MSTSSNIYQFGVLQRLAFAVGSALVDWAERAARRSAAARPAAATRARRAEQRRQAEERREKTITEAYLMPRQF